MMKKALAVLACLCVCAFVLVLVPASAARADCQTQGALARSLAEILKLDASSAGAAAAALAALGVQPQDGWQIDACLTPEIVDQVRVAYSRAAEAAGPGALAVGAVDQALDLVGGLQQQYEVSPFKP